MQRVVRQFVGFCVLYLGLAPTMDHVMEPICVAKYWGFHVAKGTSVASIKKDMVCLSQVPFYIFNKCINGTTTFDRSYTKDVQKWYTNLLSQLKAKLRAISKATTPSSLTKGITLHGVWESLNQEIDGHIEELKVRCERLGGGDQREGPTHTTPTLFPFVGQQICVHTQASQEAP